MACALRLVLKYGLGSIIHPVYLSHRSASVAHEGSEVDMKHTIRSMGHWQADPLELCPCRRLYFSFSLGSDKLFIPSSP